MDGTGIERSVRIDCRRPYGLDTGRTEVSASMAVRGARVISVIIPAFNEERALPQTLRALFTQLGDYEVIIIDGGSHDRTIEIIRSFRDVQFFAAPKGRASQMNTGAKEARGEWLLFLHADTVLPFGAIQRLNEMETDRTIQAGGFMHRFSGDDWRLKLISFLDNLRCIHSRIIYGDQALFVRRALFEQLGGFPNRPILEDVAFCERLISVTTPLLLSQSVVTDAPQVLGNGRLA
jgi:rSAM/selenodomain-associated transferase 2